jgi:hypothetical protein
VKQEDISPNVRHALKLDSKRRVSLIEEKCPKSKVLIAVLVPLLKKFSGVEGSRIYNELVNRQTVYLGYALKKK